MTSPLWTTAVLALPGQNRGKDGALQMRAARDAKKYALCGEFGSALPAIRKCVERDLARRAIDRSTVLAAVVRLLDRGRVRIGNENFARSNKSYGATTLRKRRAHVEGQAVTFEYVGKSGKAQALSSTLYDFGHVQVQKRLLFAMWLRA